MRTRLCVSVFPSFSTAQRIDRPTRKYYTATTTETGRLRRCVFEGELSEVNGLADDYAFLARGLLDLYEATGETAHLEWAARLQVGQ